MREGDKVIVYKLDRLGRSLRHLISEMDYFHSKGVEFASIKENIDTTTPSGKLFFHIFASMSEFERDIIVERTQAGLKAARARGREGGRPFKLSESERAIVKKLYNDSETSLKDICNMFGISRRTIYNIVA